MLLVNVLNKALKEVPNIANRLESLIKVQEWDETKKKYAISIVQGLPLNLFLCKPVSPAEKAYVQLKPIPLFLLDYQLDEISKERDLSQIDKFFEEVLTEINGLSSEIYFSYGGHYYDNDDDMAEITINWYI